MKHQSRLHLLRLLQVVDRSLPSDALLSIGLDYSQIARLLGSAIDHGLVEKSENGPLQLSRTGKSLMVALERPLQPASKSQWALPLDKHKIRQLGKFDVYLPETYNFD